MSNRLALLTIILILGGAEGQILAPASAQNLNTGETPMKIELTTQQLEDLQTVCQRLVRSQVITDLQTLKNTTATVVRYRDSLGADGKWEGLVYADMGHGEWGPSTHLDRVVAMAKVYVSDGRLKGDAALKSAILRSLDAFFEGDYQNKNWWFNQIGVPIQIGTILLLMGSEVSPQQIERGLVNLKRSVEASPMKKWTGANLSWIARTQIMRGLLTKNPEMVDESFRAMWGEVKIEPIGREGIQADFSFHQHGPLIYNGGYGGAFMSDAVLFQSYARGTAFALPINKVKILTDFMLDGQDWMARLDFDPSVCGREITRRDTGVNYSVRSMAKILAEGNDYRQAELTEMSKRLEKDGKSKSGNRNFWRADYMTHHRAGYFTSVRTFSARTQNTDGSADGRPINLEGRKSLHVADGATYIMRRGNEYNEIFPVWDWGRVPGTTTEQRPAFNEAKIMSRGKTTFVGGVSDGTYGAATMDLSRDGLNAKKSWFFFDDEFVALGTGITNTSQNPVLTSVNQSYLHGEVRVSNQAEALLNGERATPNTRWVLHDETGYIFPANTSLHVANQAQHGKWSEIGTGSKETVSKDIFSLWVDHGVQPTDASYEYIVVPNTDAATLANLIEKPIVEMLSNTTALQAVRHNGLKIVQAIFRQAGGLEGGKGWTLKVDQPCIMMIREIGTGVELSLANPENKPLVVNVEIDRHLQGEGTAMGQNVTNIRFDLPDGVLAGSSVVRRFETAKF